MPSRIPYRDQDTDWGYWEPYLFLCKNQIGMLTTAANTAMLCNVVHKSVSYLDLSILEWSRKLRTVSTESALQNYFLNEEGDVINHLNLDSSRHFYRPIEIVEGLKRLGPMIPYFSIRRICVHRPVYLKHFDDYLIMLVNKSEDKLATIRRCVKIIDTTGLCRDTFLPKIYIAFINVLIEEKCDDSSLVEDFVKACGGNMIFYILAESNCEYLLEFVLFHAQKTHFKVFDLDVFISCPLSFSIREGRANNIELLLKFGHSKQKTIGKMESAHLISLPNDDESQVYHYPIREDVPLRRNQLISELFALYYPGKKYPDGLPDTLLLLWRSRPDCFLTKHELDWSFPYPSVAEYKECRSYLDEVWAFYEDALGRDRHFCPGGPRTLAHLARCEVRSVMGRTHALPDGVDALDVPCVIKSYLKLEC